VQQQGRRRSIGTQFPSLLPEGCESITDSEDEDGDTIMAEVNNSQASRRADRVEKSGGAARSQNSNSAKPRSDDRVKLGGGSERPQSSNRAEQDNKTSNSQDPMKPTESQKSKQSQRLLDEYADSIRSNVMQRGYLETRDSWIAWPQYINANNQEERDETLAYLRYCRDLALTFDRHGAARSREVLEALPVHRRLNGVWNQRVVYNSWFDARSARVNGRRWVAGWVSQSWEQVLADRPTRIELLSLDGQEDTLYEFTEFDTEYMPIFGPQLGPVQHLEIGLLRQPRPDNGHLSEEQRLNGTGATSAPASTALRETIDATSENATSLQVKKELLAEIDTTASVATMSGETRDGSAITPAAASGNNRGQELYDPAHPTTEPTNTTAQPSVDDLPPLLSAMVFRGSVSKK
jgi:hypothetical protein